MGRFCVQKKLEAFANLYWGEISGKILFITLFRKNRNFARNTTPVDIPDSWDWDPRAQQQPTGLLLPLLRRVVLFASSSPGPQKQELPHRSAAGEFCFWWSEATQIRTIALWGIFGGDFIESDDFCAVFVVECNQNFFIIKINGVHECIDERFPMAFHVWVELAEPGQPETNLIFA